MSLRRDVEPRPAAAQRFAAAVRGPGQDSRHLGDSTGALSGLPGPLTGRYSDGMDENDAIVRLCVQGMECESRGDFAQASQLFMNAWVQSKDDFDRCIAAHYVARHQENGADALLWNERSLEYANAAGPDRVREFYPSLYLNVAKSHEDLGNLEDARTFYELAEKVLDSLPEGQYGSVVRAAVDRGLQRIRV
jgi:tetratricopeptide (TPR) repeat protein